LQRAKAGRKLQRWALFSLSLAIPLKQWQHSENYAITAVNKKSYSNCMKCIEFIIIICYTIYLEEVKKEQAEVKIFKTRFNPAFSADSDFY